MSVYGSLRAGVSLLAGFGRGQRRRLSHWLTAFGVFACVAACSSDLCDCASVIDDCLDEAKDDAELTDAEVERCGALERVCLTECERAEASEPDPLEGLSWGRD